MLQGLKRARATSEAAAKQLSQACSEIGDDRPLGGCAFSPDGRVLAACGWGGHVGLWGSADCRKLLGFRAAPERVTDVKWHPFALGEGVGGGGGEGEGEEGEAGVVALATGCADGTVSLWTRGGQALSRLEGHTDRCGRIAFHPMGRHLVSGQGGVVSIRD
jgi:U4/U6 small nuclear ribonucleoprotein PRP4